MLRYIAPLDQTEPIHHQDYLAHNCSFKDRTFQSDVHRGETHWEEARQAAVYRVVVHQEEAHQAQVHREEVHREEAHRAEVSPYRIYSRSHKGIMEATSWWGIHP